MRIAIVAGEHSGDLLGAGLIEALRQRYPDAEFVGIGGPSMIAAGFNSLFPMERLAVMGLVEVLSRLRELLSIRRQLVESFAADPPDVFIGIDAPDFNLHLAFLLKQHAIPTVHYVSPSVWAWRQGRIKKIKRAVDLMLTLFPFEADFYRQHNMAVRFVGHPLADQIEMASDAQTARQQLGLSTEAPVLALLPGSRSLELKYNTEAFLRTAERCIASIPSLQIVVPFVSERRQQEFMSIRDAIGSNVPIIAVSGQARTVMTAANAVLLASGTATLEAALIKRPMVVSYRMAALSFAIIRRMVKVKYVALPNLLLDQPLVPEFLQDAQQPEAIARVLVRMLTEADYQRSLHHAFTDIHRQLKQDASKRAAEAIALLLQSPKESMLQEK